MTQDLLPLTRIPRAGLPPYALVVGDPLRAALVAARLDGAQEVSYHREYRVFSGSWKGLPVTVASHGVGAPGAILLFQEHRGIVWTRAAFQPGLIPLNAYAGAGLAAIEMELAALLVTASLRGLVAGGVLVVDGVNADELLDVDVPFSAGGYDPHREVVAAGVERGALVSLLPLRLLAEQADAGEEGQGHGVGVA